VVKEAIRQNAPNRIVLNHMDYVDPDCGTGAFTRDAMDFVDWIETGIGQPVDLLGTAPADVVRRQSVKVKEAA
jgi:adenylosuccinate synthase